MADATETMKKTADAATEAFQAGAEKAQSQAETFQAAGAKAFREGVDKSVAGMGELNAETKKTFDAMMASAVAAQKGAEALSAQGVAFGKKSWEDGVAAAQQLASARSVQELIELQTAWAKSASEAYVSELTKLTETVTASVKDTFQPLNERVTASVEKLQTVR